MRRRDVIAGLATLLVAPKRSSAQQVPAKLPCIGILSPAARPDAAIFDAFRKGLADLGYIDGQNIRIEYRLSAGDFSRLPAIAEELVRLPVDVIFADGPTVVIAHEATRTIPIIGGVGADPVAAGLIGSFAHPGGNVTGFSAFGVELSAKRLQLLKEASPRSRMSRHCGTDGPEVNPPCRRGSRRHCNAQGPQHISANHSKHRTLSTACRSGI